MAASVQIRPHNRDLGMIMREVDEDLAIFLGIQKGEMESNNRVLVEESDEFDDSKSVESKPESSFGPNASQAETYPVEADNNSLNLEMEKSETNWPLSQPDTSPLPTVEADVQGPTTSQTNMLNVEAVSLKSELEKTCGESNGSSKLAKPLDDRKPTRRAATPTGRASLPAKPKTSRASTPTSRPTLPSSKPVSAERRSSTPLGRTPRSSTPNSRPSIPIISKSVTPTRKPATPSTTSTTLPTLDRSLSGQKTGTAMVRNSGQSRGTSPTVRSRPSKPSERLSLSHDAPQNPKVSMPKRPVSASRGRTSGNPARLSSSNEKPGRKSCSPPRVRAPMTTVYKTGSRILSRSRNGDDVNPVLMWTKMVDRVVNMRKLAPPKQDEYVCHDQTRKSLQENSGFGRSLSKKSLDMAMRHMDIRRSVATEKSTTGSGKISTVVKNASP